MKKGKLKNVMSIYGDEVTYVEFKTLQLHNFIKNVQKLYRRFFFHKINKIKQKFTGVKFWPQFPIKNIFLFEILYILNTENISKINTYQVVI